MVFAVGIYRPVTYDMGMCSSMLPGSAGDCHSLYCVATLFTEVVLLQLNTLLCAARHRPTGCWLEL